MGSKHGRNCHSQTLTLCDVHLICVRWIQPRSRPFNANRKGKPGDGCAELQLDSLAAPPGGAAGREKLSSLVNADTQRFEEADIMRGNGEFRLRRLAPRSHQFR